MFDKWHRTKVPTILQMEAVECGAASLAMVLAYFKCYVPLEQVRIDCGVSRDGSKASNLLKVASKYGLEAHGYRKSVERVRELKGPMILHWNFNHFIVLERFSKKGAYINDPATGRRVVSYEEFELSFTGVVITFEPSNKFKPMGNRESNIKVLLSRLKESKTALAYGFLIGLILVATGLIVPAFSRVFIDEILINGRQSWLTMLLLGMSFTAILRGILIWMQNTFFMRFETKLSIMFSSTFLWHVLRVPAVFYTQRDAGDISYRMQSNQKIAKMLANKIAPTVLNVFSIIFYYVLIYHYDWRLALIVLSTALINIGYLSYMSNNRKELSMRFIRDRGKLNAVSMNGITMIETLKATGSENDFFENWAGYQAKASCGQQKIGLSTQMLATLPSFFTQFSQIMVLAVGASEIIRGNMTIGTLVAFQTLTVSFNSALLEIIEVSTRYQELIGDLKRVEDVCQYALDEEIVKDEAKDLRVAIQPLSGTIAIKGLTFGYSALEGPLIDKFSMKLKLGQRVALVGGSGSGKSTIGKLIAGIYKPWEGQITIDGRERSAINRTELCHALAVVDQDISIFSGTIRDNICLWDKVITDEEVIEAAKDACIHDVIVTKQGGYSHQLEERGANLSGGQKQRIEIARALAKSPKILIMDEATSALDSKTENMIMENIKRRGCTCIIIAHRLSTIRDCDEIIVLERGEVVQRGTHEALVVENGVYGEMIQSAS